MLLQNASSFTLWLLRIVLLQIDVYVTRLLSSQLSKYVIEALSVHLSVPNKSIGLSSVSQLVPSVSQRRSILRKTFETVV